MIEVKNILGRAVISKGKERDFRKKVPARWMIERSRYGRGTKLYVYFTCPHDDCGGINKAYLNRYEDEQHGRFLCIMCSHCRRGLSIQCEDFVPELERIETEKQKRRLCDSR